MTPLPLAYGAPSWFFLVSVEFKPKWYLLWNVGTVWMNLHQGGNSFPHVNTWLRRVYVAEYPANETWMKVFWGWDCFQERLLRSLKNRGPNFLELLFLLAASYVKLLSSWCETSCQVNDVRLAVRFFVFSFLISATESILMHSARTT